YQSARRVGHLERRFLLPIGTAITSDIRTVPADATLDEFHQHLLLTRVVEVPVVDASRYVGMITIHDLQALAPTDWATTTVGSVLRDEWPTGTPGWTLERASRAMEADDIDTLPVVDGDTFIRVVTTANIIRLDEILG